MRHLRFSSFFPIAVFCMFLFHSCNTCSRPTTIDSVVVDLTDLANFAVDSLHINISGKMLYASSKPSPIEVSMLIKNWGNAMDVELNDPANASAYLTKRKMAVNFGVYITDMVTAGLYGQTQTVLRYRQALVPLVEGLGLQSAIDPQKVQQLEKNINNRQELLNIISEIYAACTAFLSEDARDFYALAILTGGWVEGMYIGVGMIDEKQSSNESKMKEFVMDNKTTFDILWLALGQIDDIPEDAISLMLEMSYIAQIFGHETLLTTPPRNGVIRTENDVTPALFADLKNYVQLLRQQFVKR